MVKRLLQGQRGQGLVEYALIIFLVAVAVVGILTFLSGNIGSVFSNIVTKL